MYIKESFSKLLENRSSLIKILAVVLLFFGGNLYLSYATDTYVTLAAGFQRSAIDMATRNGRPVIGLIYELHYLSGLPSISFYYISSALALLFLCMSIWIYQRILKKYGIKENIRVALAFAAIANILIIEYFMFIEKCGFMLAILFNVLAVYWTEKFFTEENKRCLVLALAFMVLAIFTYQGTTALYVMLSIPFAMKRARNFKQYLLHGITIGVIYFIPAVVDLLALKFVFKSTRIAEKIDLASTLETELAGIVKFTKETFNILPNYVFEIVLIVIVLAITAGAIISHNRVWRLFNVFIIVVASIIFSTATILQGSGWWSSRTVYPLASMPAILIIDFLINADAIASRKTVSMNMAIKMISLSAISILMIVQYLSFNSIYIDKYKLNALDQYRYQYIYQAICDYQEESGTEITKIAIYNDATNAQPQYSDLYCTGDLVVSAFSTTWSNVTAMNYYLNTSYKKIDPLIEYAEYFSGKNWDYLSSDQLIFDGDTLHLCVY